MERSLAGTTQNYTRIQGRVSGVMLHVQGDGGHGNREYGVAVNFDVAHSLRNWLTKQNHCLVSASPDSHKRYVPMQARLNDDDEQVQFQIEGSVGNRDYGYAFVVVYNDPNITPLVAWLRDQKND